MNITSHQIETWAVNKVDEVFTRSPRITSSISRRDKDPVWDGAIYLASSDNSLIQKIPVQVKGKIRKALPLRPSYSISVTNLKSYLRDGGILYCVVFIIGNERFFHYAKLAPIDLKRYIKLANGQASISVQLKPFNKSVSEMELELESFINDCKRQTSYVDSPILTINDAIKRGYKINFQLSGVQSSNLTTFIEEPVYLYAEIQTDDTKTYYPIGDTAYNIVPGKHIYKPVSANGKPYYDKFLIFDKGKEVTFIVDNVLEVHYKKDTNIHTPTNTKIGTNAELLSERINDLSFISDIFSTNEVCLGELVVKFKNISPKQIREAQEGLLYHQKIRKLFDKLHIFEDINIGNFSADDINNLSILMDAIIDKKPIKLKKPINIISHIDISQYRICLFIEECENGTFLISDFFEAEEKLRFAYENKKGEKFITSMFSAAFWLNDFAKFSNVDYSRLIPSYESAKKHNPFIIERANNDMLMAIMAYDKKESKDSKLYDAIVELNNWIITNVKEISPINIINKYQIIKRKRVLERPEKMELYNLLHTNIRADMEAAIHLLLDNETQFEISYDKMKPQERQFFDSLPISYFKKIRYQ